MAYDGSHPDWPLKDIYTLYRFQEENLGLMRFKPHTGRCYIHIDLKTEELLDGTWLSIMSASSENWMHWMSESIPRLARVQTAKTDINFGLLVDQELTKNMRDVLDIFAKGNPRVEVAPHHAVKVSRLIVPTNATGTSAFWVRNSHSAENRRRFNRIPSQFRTSGVFHFDMFGLKLARKMILEHFDLKPRKKRKLFILRRSFFRHITNQEHIERLLLAHGFEPISPGEMSVEEQVKTFSEASIVVAQAGAALANIMFMPEGAKVICLSARSPEYVNYDYFRDYAANFSVSLEYLLGDIDDPSKYNATHVGQVTHPMNAEFSCPEDELIKMFTSLQ
ncbi:MAG: glycosyltransferase family 61 protein [Gallionella sp.]|nr:glycosyltransferase family 61 protein [Gallionella sp.]